METFKVKACSPPSCGCPTLEIEQSIDGVETVIITDDYNGVVQMTKEEFFMLADAYVKQFASYFFRGKYIGH